MDIVEKVEEMKRKAETLAREARRRESPDDDGAADGGPAGSNAPSVEGD